MGKDSRQSARVAGAPEWSAPEWGTGPLAEAVREQAWPRRAPRVELGCAVLWQWWVALSRLRVTPELRLQGAAPRAGQPSALRS